MGAGQVLSLQCKFFIMWVYRRNPDVHLELGKDEFVFNLYQVGYLQDVWEKDEVIQQFQVVQEYHHDALARSAVNYLNGGNSSVEVSGVVYNKS